MRAGPGPADRRELPESSSRLDGHDAELPLDLLAHSVWAVRGGEPRGLGGVRRGAQGMRTHVRDCGGLSGRSGGSRSCRAAHLACGAVAGKPAADLICDVKFATAEGPCSGDRIAGAGVTSSFGLEQSEHSLRAVSCPDGHDSSFGFAERLR